MAATGNHRLVRGDRVPPLAGGGRGVSPRPLHTVGAGGDGAPLAGRPPAGGGTAVSRDQQTDARVDDDGDAGGVLAASRRRWIPAGGPPGGGGPTRPRKIRR